MRRLVLCLLLLGTASSAGAPAPLFPSLKPAEKSLIDRLIAESLKKEPIKTSSVAINEHLTHRCLPECLHYINKHSDYRSYRLLLALRRDQPKAYKRIPPAVRATVLCSTLKEQDYFDDWWQDPGGEAERLVSESEQALVEIGRPAIRYLLPLLDDRTPAEISEIENSADGPAYEDYRRADYAFLYISWIQRRPYQFQPKPDDRDKAIEALKKQLIVEMKAKN